MAFKFKSSNRMLPSEMTTYIKDLENEVRQNERTIKSMSVPDAYVATIYQPGDKGKKLEFGEEASVISAMKIGQVAQAATYRNCGEKYIVKVSNDRIDRYDSAIEAEHVAMLHR